MAKMREMPINDFMTKNGKLREDGRVMRDMYLFEVKKPAESKGPWDYYKLLADDSRRSGLPPAERERLPAGEEGDVDGRRPSPAVRRAHASRLAAMHPRRSPAAVPALLAQLLIGLINGSFYAMLSLGLAVIFGMLNIINFTHGAQYMLGAFCACLLLNYLGIGYWPALVLAPIVVGAFGMVLERLFIRHLYQLDHLYGLLLTFGLALIIEGVFRQQYGSSGLPYSIPDELTGAHNLGFMFLPNYRAWVIVASLVVCFAHLVRDRAHAARRLSARRDREPDAGPGVRHQRAAHDHADLRLRRRRLRRSPACWRRRSIR